MGSAIHAIASPTPPTYLGVANLKQYLAHTAPFDMDNDSSLLVSCCARVVKTNDKLLDLIRGAVISKELETPDLEQLMMIQAETEADLADLQASCGSDWARHRAAKLTKSYQGADPVPIICENWRLRSQIAADRKNLALHDFALRRLEDQRPFGEHHDENVSYSDYQSMISKFPCLKNKIQYGIFRKIMTEFRAISMVQKPQGAVFNQHLGRIESPSADVSITLPNDSDALQNLTHLIVERMPRDASLIWRHRVALLETERDELMSIISKGEASIDKNEILERRLFYEMSFNSQWATAHRNLYRDVHLHLSSIPGGHAIIPEPDADEQSAIIESLRNSLQQANQRIISLESNIVANKRRELTS